MREISETYDLQVLRFFMLSAHYRSPLNFSADLMEAAKNGLERIVNAAENLRHLKKNARSASMTEEEREIWKGSDVFVEKFEAAMDDDFNTADAIACVFELVKYSNTRVNEESSAELSERLGGRLQQLCDILGILLEQKEDILDEEIERLIAERQAARKDRNFARADEIREILLNKGIVLEDTREGVK